MIEPGTTVTVQYDDNTTAIGTVEHYNDVSGLVRINVNGTILYEPYNKITVPESSTTPAYTTTVIDKSALQHLSRYLVHEFQHCYAINELPDLYYCNNTINGITFHYISYKDRLLVTQCADTVDDIITSILSGESIDAIDYADDCVVILK